MGETIIGNKRHLFPRKPGTSYILNRQEFICQLAEKAEKLGAIIQTNDKIKTIDDLDSDYIIDASGCPSSMKKELGFKNSIIGVTYQQTLEDSNCFVSDTAKIVFSGGFSYFWIFPRDPEKKEINIGIGFLGDFHDRLKEVLETFKREQKIEGKINYVTGGFIPLGLQRPLRYKNILFVGDAGVGAFPFTGQGIYRALISGDVAGMCIAQHNPKKYSYIMQQKFIKWDVFGKAFIRMNYILRKVNPKLVLAAFQCMVDMSGMAHG